MSTRDGKPIGFGDFTSNVGAIGGFFFVIDVDALPLAGKSIQLSATDATGSATWTVVDPSPTSFVGFVSTGSLALLQFAVVATADPPASRHRPVAPRGGDGQGHNRRSLPPYPAGPRAMIYKFKSKAAGDVIMMGAAGDEVLRALGKSPGPSGIIEPAAMPAAIAALEKAVAAEEADRAAAEKEAAAAGRKLAPRQGVSLRQRAWPLVEMMRRSLAEQAEIVWGV